MDAKDVKNGEINRAAQLANAQDALESFLLALESSKPPEWDALPDIGLYMDQVINYLERQIGSLFPPNKEGAITSSMIFGRGLSRMSRGEPLGIFPSQRSGAKSDIAAALA